LLRLLDDNDTLAKLLTSINTANTGYKRTVSPFRAAELIQRLISEEGMDVTLAVLPLKKDMITNFLRLRSLPEECHDAIFWGESGDIGVGFTSASEIAELKDRNDMIYLFSRAMDKKITKTEIIEIKLFSKNKKISIRESTDKILGSRVEQIMNHMIVFELSKTAKKLLSDIIEKTKSSEKEVIITKLKENAGLSNVKGISIKGDRVGIILDFDNYKMFKQIISDSKIDYDYLGDFILQ